MWVDGGLQSRIAGTANGASNKLTVVARIRTLEYPLLGDTKMQAT